MTLSYATIAPISGKISRRRNVAAKLEANYETRASGAGSRHVSYPSFIHLLLLPQALKTDVDQLLRMGSGLEQSGQENART